MTDLTTLIEKLEKAEEGSVELDAEIMRALATYCVANPELVIIRKGWGDKVWSWADRSPRYPYASIEEYPFTTSVDAALSFVPGRLNWDICHREDDHVPELSHTFAIVGEHSGESKNAPLALCIAALKARSAT